MSRRDDSALLADILRYGRQARAFCAGRARVELDDDPMFREALIRELEVVGQAVGRLSTGWIAARPQVPWSDWVGLRNRLIHGYFAVDLDIGWSIAEHDLPSLLAVVEAAVESGRGPGA